LAVAWLTEKAQAIWAARAAERERGRLLDRSGVPAAGPRRRQIEAARLAEAQGYDTAERTVLPGRQERIAAAAARSAQADLDDDGAYTEGRATFTRLMEEPAGGTTGVPGEGK